MKCYNLLLYFTSFAKLALIARILPTRYALHLGLNFSRMTSTSVTSTGVPSQPANNNTVDCDTLSESDLTPMNSGDDRPMPKAIKRKRIGSPELSPQVKPARKRKAHTKDVSTPMQDEINAFIDEKVAAKRRAMDATTEPKLAADDEGERPEASAIPSPKKRKPRAPKPEPVYVIPDVERLETKFKGRLGMSSIIVLLCFYADFVIRLCLHELYSAQQEASQSSYILCSHLPVGESFFGHVSR